MSIQRQNRSLLVFFVLGLLALVFVLSRNGAFEGLQIKDEEVRIEDYLEESPTALEGGSERSQSENGGAEGQDLGLSDEELEARVAYAQILTDLGDCFGLKGDSENSQAPITVDTLISRYQSALGPVVTQEDRFLVWYFRDSEGQERRLRVENRRTSEGKINKIVNLYRIDIKGTEVFVPPPGGGSYSGDSQEIQEILRGGDVFYKEGASSLRMGGGAEINFATKNDEISELEFVSGDRLFRCDSLRAREACQCVR